MLEFPAGLRSNDTIAVNLLPALKSHDGIPRLFAEDAVYPAGLEVAERLEPPLQRGDRAPTVAVAQLGRRGPTRQLDSGPHNGQLSCRRRTGQHKQDDGRSKKSATGSSVDAASRVVAAVGQEPLYGFAHSPKPRPHNSAGSASGSALLLMGRAS